MNSKKIILFIVEGVSDKAALGSIMKKYFKEEKIDFQVTYGDITSKIDVDTNNVISSLNSHIKNYMEKYHYKISDFKSFIHVIDTDGAFVPEDCIIYHDKEKTIYTEDNILTKNVEKMKKRNIRKTRIVNLLSSTNKIRNKDYKIFYFSSNLEHVLFNELNVLDNEKIKYADRFNDLYIEDINRIC